MIIPDDLFDAIVVGLTFKYSFKNFDIGSILLVYQLLPTRKVDRRTDRRQVKTIDPDRDAFCEKSASQSELLDLTVRQTFGDAQDQFSSKPEQAHLRSSLVRSRHDSGLTCGEKKKTMETQGGSIHAI
jgi:hypothetical protein